MTRLLVLGNSHVGALRMAKDAFRDRHPGVETTFFAAPGAHFLRGRTGADGIWRPHMADDRARDIIMDINGATECDLSGYDAILIVGHRFGPNLLAEILTGHDVLGLPGRGAEAPEGRVSRRFVEQAAEAWIEESTRLVARRLGNAHPFILTDAPHPTDRIGTRGDDYGRLATCLQTHPAAGMLMDFWTDRVRAAVTAHGWGFLPQPAVTMSGPAATRPEYAEAAATGHGIPSDLSDHRHMNGDFGLAMLQAWAALHAGQAGRPATRRAAS